RSELGSLLAQLLRVVLAEHRLPGRDGFAKLFQGLQLTDRHQLDLADIAAGAHAGRRDALPHPGQPFHGSSTPAAASIERVSASGSPTTLVKLPSMRSTNAPASPCTAYAPALSSPSPESTSHRTCSEDSGWNFTVVSTLRKEPPTQTAVITLCSIPDKSRSIRSASDLSRGLPSTSPPATTMVSAAS